jgi:hypothetical protein
MKKKSRKLVLSRETLNRLDAERMATAVGGATIFSCATRCAITYCDCGPDDTAICTWGPGNWC